QARQQFFNLVVTNVPGPQFPLYLMGHELVGRYPVVPLAARQALGIAVMSYNGHLGFGLLGDYDALPDLEGIAAHLQRSIQALSRAAGASTARRPRRAAAAGKARTRKAVKPRARAGAAKGAASAKPKAKPKAKAAAKRPAT